MVAGDHREGPAPGVPCGADFRAVLGSTVFLRTGEEVPVGFIKEQPEIPDGEYLLYPADCFHLDACESFGCESNVMMHIANNDNQRLLHGLGVLWVDSKYPAIRLEHIMGIAATIALSQSRWPRTLPE